MSKLPELNHTYKINCLDLMKELPDSSINLIVTSPPYNLGIDYGSTYSDNKPFEEYHQFCVAVYKELKRIIKPDGLVAVVIGNQRDSGIPHHHHFWMIEAGLTYMKEINWYKGCLYIQRETIFICGDKKKYRKLYPRKDGYFSNGGFSTQWQMTYPVGESRKYIKHNAFFITTIPHVLMEINTEPGDLVFDPFMGSGTTAVAAKRLGRNYLGCEINQDYIDLAEERLKNTHLWTEKEQEHMDKLELGRQNRILERNRWWDIVKDI